jgi:hypothetical protein
LTIPLAEILTGMVWRSTVWVNGLAAESLDGDPINFDPNRSGPPSDMTIGGIMNINHFHFHFNHGGFDGDWLAAGVIESAVDLCSIGDGWSDLVVTSSPAVGGWRSAGVIGVSVKISCLFIYV